MKTHTTIFLDTFIEVPADTKADCGTKPPSKDKKTVAEMQYELVAASPYKYTSDEIFFQVFADKNDLTTLEYEEARQQFFSKGQPCFRASPLTKTYGFGIHCNSEGKVALFGRESAEYQGFLDDPKIKKIKAMQSSR